MKDILKNNINNAINSLKQKDINQAIDYIYSSLSEIEIDSKIFTNVETMRYANLKEGDIVRTKGYYKGGDGGAATYEIMTYDNWLNSLEEKLRIVCYHVDRVGVNPYYYKNPVDDVGNHLLKNGLVAAFKIDEDNIVKVEQWGLFEGRKDNAEIIKHIFAYNRTNTTILFGKNKTYKYYYNRYNRFDKIKDRIADVAWFAPNKGTGNEYVWALGCRSTTKPSLGCVKNLVLDGNGCKLYIPKNEFCGEGFADWATIQLGSDIDGLIIKNFIFDPNGLEQYGYYDSKGIWHNMTVQNHTISYFATGYGISNALSTGTNVTEEGLAYTKCLNNFEVCNNIFYANGTMVNTSDGGGDHILIINPLESSNINIHDNEFYDWGRWVFAVDLGGNGERFYNYKFNNNKCIQTDINMLDTGLYRGLGFIDFEARKCWSGLEVKNNYVYGLTGWAFNGNGKISDNIVISGNTIIRDTTRQYKSAYQYLFEWYSVYPKDVTIENNYFDGGGTKLGLSCHNFYVRNNIIKNTYLNFFGLYGDMIFENNSGTNKLFNFGGNLPPYITDETNEAYIPENERQCNLTYRNNIGGFSAYLFSALNPNKYKYIKPIIENNILPYCDAILWGLDFEFDANQISTNNEVSIRGGKYINQVVSNQVNNPVPGGGIWKAGDIVSTTANIITRTNGYYSNLKILGKNTLKAINDGYLPMSGSFKKCEGDIKYYSGAQVSDNSFVYTDTDLYAATVKGNLGETAPTHTNGIEENGTTSLLWLAKLAGIEVAEEDSDIQVSSIKIINNNSCYDIGQTLTFLNSVYPSSATTNNRKFEWSVSNDVLEIKSIVSNAGLNSTLTVMPKKSGDCIITCTETTTGVSAAYTVNIPDYSNETEFTKWCIFKIDKTNEIIDNKVYNQLNNSEYLELTNVERDIDGGFIFTSENKSKALLINNILRNKLFIRESCSIEIEYKLNQFTNNCTLISDNTDTECNTYMKFLVSSNKMRSITSKGNCDLNCNFNDMLSTVSINFYGDKWAQRYKNGRSINNSDIAFYNTENNGALCIGGNDILNEYSDITIYSIKIFDKSLNECLFIKDYHYFINNK